jgi:hypothetical protein
VIELLIIGGITLILEGMGLEKKENNTKIIGDGFEEEQQKQHRENFQNYLGSCARYLSNKRMRKDIKYYG